MNPDISIQSTVAQELFVEVYLVCWITELNNFRIFFMAISNVPCVCTGGIFATIVRVVQAFVCV